MLADGIWNARCHKDMSELADDSELAYDRAAFAADVLDQGAVGAALQSSRAGQDRVYLDDGSFWADLRGTDWHRIGRVRLVGFVLTEWLPLSPGLYHHPASAQRRWEAQRHSRIEDGQRVYDLSGKIRMIILGGVGSLRLEEHEFEGQRGCLLGASSSGYSHTGIPVLCSGGLWNQVRERMARHGALHCDLVGRLRPIPDSASLYKYGSPLISAFLQVEDLDFGPYENAPPPQARASFAVMFGDPLAWQHYSFATFKPGDPASLQYAVEWLRGRYGLGQTSVLNDFDEREQHFRDAAVEFALSRVMVRDVDLARIIDYGCNLGFYLHPTREANGAWLAYDRGLHNLEGHLDRLALQDRQEVMPHFKDLEDRLRRSMDREQTMGLSLGLEAERRVALTALNDLSKKYTGCYFTEHAWRSE